MGYTLHMLQRTSRFLLLAACLSLLFAAPAEAKDLRKRFGLGFTTQFSPVSSLSAKITLPAPNPTINIQIQALVGFAILAKQNNTFFAGGRFLYTFIAEDNLNVYGGIGVGWVRWDAIEQAVRIQPVVGVEFFFFGLENLGISAEGGVTVDAGTAGVDVMTSSGNFLGAGVHYYF